MSEVAVSGEEESVGGLCVPREDGQSQEGRQAARVVTDGRSEVSDKWNDKVDLGSERRESRIEAGKSADASDKSSVRFDSRILDRIADEVTRDTYGTIVYQEQVSAMLRKMGFSWQEADVWQKSTKDNTKTLALAIDEMQGKPVFRKFAQKLVDDYGCDWDAAWTFTRRFTSYAFNKAHAVGYAMTAYLQMWFRVHYPLEFWSATLEMEAFEPRRRAYMTAAARDGVIFLPPHVNGTATFQVEQNAIRIGTRSVKNVGEKAAAALEAARPYSSREDLQTRVAKRQVNSRVVEALRGAGALEFEEAKLEEDAIAFNMKIREATINLNVYSRMGAES